MNSKEILETILPENLKAKPELAKDINAIIHFDISGEGGGKWTLDCTKPDNWVSTGANGDSKMTVSMSNDDFVKIKQGKLNSQMAAMQGKIKFKPMDMGLAMKLAKLLG